jgi:glycerol kinase
MAMLPEVVPSGGQCATATKDVLGAPVAIAGIAGDQQAALFGQGCVTPGMAKNTYGTGCFLLMHTGSRAVASRHGLLTTVACDAEGGRPTRSGIGFIAGAAVQWLRRFGLLAFEARAMPQVD